MPSEGQTIAGEYILGPELGRGSMGVVYEAVHASLQRKVALKMMLPGALALEGVVERFMRGAQLASALTHDNAVLIYGVGLYQPIPDAEGLPFMIMEHLDGEDLYEFMSARGRLDLTTTLDILTQCLEVLADAHGRGIIHRDLKPENLFLTTDAKGKMLVKVLDFGLAKAVTEGWGQLAQRLTAIGMTCGTPEYMAPEQAVGEEKVGPALDVYAMGCIIYHMLTGEAPFLGANPLAIALQHVQEGAPALPAAYRQHYIDAITRRCMAKLPEVRFRDAGHLLEVLRQAAEGDDPELDATWPARPLLEAPFRPARKRIHEARREAMAVKTLVAEDLSMDTVQMLPVLTSKQDENDLEWVGQTLQAHALPGDVHAHLLDPLGLDDGETERAYALRPGAIEVDLNAHEEVIDYTAFPGAATVILGQPGTPTEVDPIHPNAPDIKTIPLDIIRSDAKNPDQPRGLLWIAFGVGLLVAMAVLALGVSFIIQSPRSEKDPDTSGVVAEPELITLKIRSDPPGARVLLDGQAQGETPFVLRTVPAKRVARIEIRKDGFKNQVIMFNMSQSESMNLLMQPLPKGWMEEPENP